MIEDAELRAAEASLEEWQENQVVMPIAVVDAVLMVFAAVRELRAELDEVKRLTGGQ